MSITTNDDWSIDGDGRRQYATTSDPRVLAVIEREDGYGGGRIDGDVYAPAFYINHGRPTAAGATFMDDASEEIAEHYANARSYFVNRHYIKGGRQMDYDTTAKRYLRIFHNTTIATVSSSIEPGYETTILNTPSWREHVGLDSYDEHTLDGDVESWRAAMDGEVYGVGYAVNEDGTDPDEEVDLDEWDVTIECWGYLGETYAQNAAASFENGEPELRSIDEPREYLVSCSINIEAMSAEEAARNLAHLLAQPGVPERGSYDVQLVGGRKTETVDLGEDQF